MSRDESRASQKFSDKQRVASQKAKAEKAAQKKTPPDSENQAPAQSVRETTEKS
jgi:hypothetical protein